jgi:tRNA pseudouridine13 synthase
MLAELLRSRLRADRLMHVPVAGESMPFPLGLERGELESLRAVELPLPSARSRNDLGPWQEIVKPSLAPVGLELRQVRVKYPRDSFFSKGNRPVLVFPSQLEYRVDRDELHDGRHKIVLSCELPRGAYATILTRRIAAPLAAPER